MWIFLLRHIDHFENKMSHCLKIPSVYSVPAKWKIQTNSKVSKICKRKNPFQPLKIQGCSLYWPLRWPKQRSGLSWRKIAPLQAKPRNNRGVPGQKRRASILVKVNFISSRLRSSSVHQFGASLVAAPAGNFFTVIFFTAIIHGRRKRKRSLFQLLVAGGGMKFGPRPEPNWVYLRNETQACELGDK